MMHGQNHIKFNCVPLFYLGQFSLIFHSSISFWDVNRSWVTVTPCVSFRSLRRVCGTYSRVQVSPV